MLRVDNIRRAVLGANILCGLVASAGVLVMLGWFLDIPILKSIYPGWVTMKFATAFSFVLSGVLVYSVGRIARGERSWAHVLLPGFVLMLLLPMAGLLGATMLDVDIGMTEIFVQERSGAVLSVLPGRPSLMSIVCFTLVAAVGVVAMFAPNAKPRLWRMMGALLVMVGMVALFGYAFDTPLLYYYQENLSTAMAVHTAALFVLLGIALWLNAKGSAGLAA